MEDNTIIDQNADGVPSEAGKTRAIIAHITLIGTIIALVQNNPNKDKFASFYIRQMIGLFIIGIAVSVLASITMFAVPMLTILILILQLGIVGLWIYSIIGAVNGKESPIPVVGSMFQDWFKSL